MEQYQLDDKGLIGLFWEGGHAIQQNLINDCSYSVIANFCYLVEVDVVDSCTVMLSASMHTCGCLSIGWFCDHRVILLISFPWIIGNMRCGTGLFAFNPVCHCTWSHKLFLYS